MLLFNNVAQYAYGMIVIGLLTLKYDVVVYSFSLMPNHIHIIMSGTGNACVNAFDYIHRKLSRRLVKDGYPPLPEDYGFKLVPIENETQMRRNIIYVDRNAYEKLICVPGGYVWGTCYTHFSQMKLLAEARRADSFSIREKKSITCSHETIPDNWLFHPVVGLLPSSFIDTQLFNKLFKSPKDYLIRLVKDYEAFVTVARSLDEIVEYSTEESKDLVQKTSHEMFKGRSLSQLDQNEKGNLTVRLYKDYQLSVEQIALSINMPKHIVQQLLRAKDYGNIKELP